MSFNTAISGLNAASTELNVIGNNIANASTSGFKMSRAEFADVYPVSNFGVGANTVGAGVKVGAITQQFTQGNVNFTNSALDLAINGDGFFRLSQNGAITYSRAGAFGLDANGFISNKDGQHLTGYLANNGAITGALGDLQISLADLAPSATTAGTVGVNLDATAAIPAVPFNPLSVQPNMYNNSTSFTIYDSLGTSHLASAYFVKTGANSWDTHLFVDGNPATTGSAGTLTFNPNGSIATVNGGPVPPGTAAYTYTTVNGSNPLAFTLDYSQTTQFGSPFGVNFVTQDGYTTGRLAGIDIDGSGVLRARYTNGQSLVQGQVVLTNFTNPQGLKPQGDTQWAETSVSGAPLTGAPGTASLGLLQSGALEDSNVNLTEQLVAMITAQRNFQANAQVITTENAITQSIINMR
ncbi:MAG: flagellar hook protein FlgE [Gammaproteobacteria bacterium]|nr:flagellar hook protein FlgE [Gammaproteobacteria bacterium]